MYVNYMCTFCLCEVKGQIMIFFTIFSKNGITLGHKPPNITAISSILHKNVQICR